MSTQQNDGGPAFPHQPAVNSNGEYILYGDCGMTLRDWFAGQAMVGVMSNAQLLVYLDDQTPNKPTRFVVAKYAYDAADAMIAARNNQPEKP